MAWISYLFPNINISSEKRGGEEERRSKCRLAFSQWAIDQRADTGGGRNGKSGRARGERERERVCVCVCV
jgi:hypothetical protein